MTVRGHGGGQVNPVHEASAEQRSQRISVVGQNNLRHLRLRIAHRTGQQVQSPGLTHEVALKLISAGAEWTLRSK